MVIERQGSYAFPLQGAVSCVGNARKRFGSLWGRHVSLTLPGMSLPAKGVLWIMGVLSVTFLLVHLSGMVPLAALWLYAAILGALFSVCTLGILCWRYVEDRTAMRLRDLRPSAGCFAALTVEVLLTFLRPWEPFC